MEAESSTLEDRGVSAAQRRAEIRRRKLLMNSEQRMNRIVGFNKNDGENSARRVTEPRFHLDLDRNECFSSSVSTKRVSPFVSETRSEGLVMDERREEEEEEGEEMERGVRLRPRGETSSEEHSRSPRRGLNTYLSRFDDAIKLRGQLTNEKASQESGADVDVFDSFQLFRLLGSVVLAVCVRIFVCHYLSIFAPFLTLELAYMGLYKYFPKVDRKMKTTVLSAALLLSGIPAEVISRSAETYRTMGDVFSDLCVYFFTFITCHEIITAFSSQSS
ncbi:calcium signal-modulating cyclophilin ligand isoform X2 [Neoarius graeffei]|uniref:calcium signal-modulating cyclophilin ligand isoform X2 n=1 Tax=Neoarius graeffei TaxID=443677 RepID=UPI00298D256F|nr:calcium signal-modulating cyclophilin ligand isoform X2 [Neoarius graeffei]